MKSLNKVFILGRIGTAPELLTTKNGQPYTKLNIATQRSWRDENDAKVEQTDWHHVLVFGPQARVCSQGIQKGAVVLVEGQLSPYSAIREDGGRESRQSVHAQRVTFFNSLAGGDAGHPAALTARDNAQSTNSELIS